MSENNGDYPATLTCDVCGDEFSESQGVRSDSAGNVLCPKCPARSGAHGIWSLTDSETICGLRVAPGGVWTDTGVGYEPVTVYVASLSCEACVAAIRDRLRKQREEGQ